MFQQYYVGRYKRVMTLSPEQAADKANEAEPYDPDKHDELLAKAAKDDGDKTGGDADAKAEPKPRAGTLLPGGDSQR